MMVKTGAEQRFLKTAKDLLCRELCAVYSDACFYFFRKTLKTRKGVFYESPLFPGYVFMKTAVFDPAAVPALLKRAEGFYHFLPSNSDAAELSGTDLEYVKNFSAYGEVLGASQAYFDENQRIVITGGPLKGFAGNIIRVNRRTNRVTVRIDLYGSPKTVDLLYDEVAAEE